MTSLDDSHPTCTGVLVPVEDSSGDIDPAAALVTSGAYRGVTVEQIRPMLDPASWPVHLDFWCEMIEEPNDNPNVRRFVEVVASECPPSAPLTTRLDFAARDLADGSISLEYWLSEDQSFPADGLVIVDEGSILVEPFEDEGAQGIRISTTKRIRFDGPLDGAQLAMVACALGWDGAGDKFVFALDRTDQ